MSAPWDFDITKPGDSDNIADYPANERAQRGEVEGAFLVDHETTLGNHDQVTFNESAGDPSFVADKGFAYAKDVGGLTEMFYMDSAGTVVQLTSNGGLLRALHKDSGATAAERLMAATLRMTNAIAIVGRNFADDDDLDLMVLNASDELNIGDSDAGDVQKVRLRVADDVTDPKDQFLVEYGSSDQRIWHAGNHGASSGLDADLLDGVEGAAFMSKAGDFSNEFTDLSTANDDSTAHSLGATPILCSWYLEKTGGSAESGWVTGDRVFGEGFNPRNNSEGGGAPGLNVGADSTKVYWARVVGIKVVSRTGGSQFAISLANWKLVVRLWV